MEKNRYKLRFLRDIFAPNTVSQVAIPAMNRVLYCHAGSLETQKGHKIEMDQACHDNEALVLCAGPTGAEIWRWELSPRGNSALKDLGPGIQSTLDLEGSMDSIDPNDHWLVRCDSVKFPPNGCAFTHTHQGPGIRVLREGAIRIDAEGKSHHYLPGDAWFEAGPDPVFAQATKQGCTCFIRVMILPWELKGKSSIHYVNAEDREKPKSQRYKGYIDEYIEH